ncbi:DUF1654 domain-containing protein [Pseudomonas viridiflava]|uniref:DUF1654 domain-containing protein n=1 Tax=Pseudomonas viridiflava TaxID=33069 RepID=UPI002EC05A00|nr:DUF1654 domain-containing protein [Pseudomonas viridiflava]
MANQAHNLVGRLSSFEILVARLQKIIRSRSAQEARCATVYRTSDENPKDWDQIIAAIEETDGVHVISHDDGSAQISWDVPDEITHAGDQIRRSESL